MESGELKLGLQRHFKESVCGELRVEVRVAETFEIISVESTELGFERYLREHSSSDYSKKKNKTLN